MYAVCARGVFPLCSEAEKTRADYVVQLEVADYGERGHS